MYKKINCQKALDIIFVYRMMHQLIDWLVYTMDIKGDPH